MISKFVVPLTPDAVGKTLLQDCVYTSMSLSTDPINTPFLYSFTRMVITPTSSEVGVIAISPELSSVIAGDDEIGFDAE